MRIRFNRKDDEIRGDNFTIGKVVELPKDEYNFFASNLSKNYDFIEEYAEEMGWGENDTRNCLLVLCEGEDDGILVNSQSVNYAVYSALLPSARQIAIMAKSPSLKAFIENMYATAEHFAKQAIDLQKGGIYDIKYEIIEEYSGRDDIDYPLLIDMLCEYPEIEEIDMDRKCLELTLKDEQSEEIKVYKPTQEEVDIMCARHTLWFNGEEGKQADFSGYLLKDIKIAGNLPNAIFDNAKLVNVSFENAMIAYSTFNGAKLYDCTFDDADATSIGCKGANFYNCTFAETKLTSADLTDATFVDGSVYMADFEGSCVQGTSFEDVDMDDADFKGVYEDREQFQKDTEGGVKLEGQE